MAVPYNLIFHQKFCAAPDCRAMFFICFHCDRGHHYCGHPCRLRIRTAQRRAARRHQRSLEGRLDPIANALIDCARRRPGEQLGKIP
jgi:hypothetical protein